MEIKNIIFDVGNVLLEWNPKNIHQTLKKSYCDFPDDFLNILTKSVWQEFDEGKILEEDVVKKLSQKYSEKYLTLFIEEAKHSLTPLDRGVELMRKTAHKKRYVLSNMPKEFVIFLESKYSFFQEFEGKVFSCDVKAAKPSPIIYEILINKFNLLAEESVFIDDMKENIQRAKELGFKTIHCDDFGKVEKELTDLGVF